MYYYVTKTPCGVLAGEQSMKKLLLTTLCLVLATGVFAQENPGGVGGLDTAAYARSVAGPGATGYDAADLVESVKFDHKIAINLSDGSVSVDGTASGKLGDQPLTLADGVTISQNANGIAVSSKGSQTVAYALSGTLRGTFTVASDSQYQVLLNGATINAENGPALNLQSKKAAFLVLAEGTTNTLTDTATRIKELDEKAALLGKGRIIISGQGTLNVTGNYKYAIFAKEYVRIRGGNINVSVTARDGIRCEQGFIFDDGKLSISGTGSGIDEESKGIKVEGSESAPGKGFIIINGGYIDSKTVGKGITAAWDVKEDAKTADTSDDPNPDITINAGVITVTTTGTPYEKKDEKGNTVSCSPEGIEAKSDLVINNGYLTINTADDCLNANQSIVINGGFIYAHSSANDAIDSNGTLSVTGGVTVAIGSGGPEGAFDCDANTFSVTGGTLVGIGGTTSGPTADACTQNILIAGSYAAGTLMSIRDKTGACVFAFNIPENYTTMILSTPNLKTGTEYSIYTGGEISGGTTFHGLILGEASVSGGTLAASFVPSSVITQLGGIIFGPPPEGGVPPEGFTPPEGWTPPDGWVPPTGFNPPAVPAPSKP